MKANKLTSKLFYAVAAVLSVFLLFLIASCSWDGGISDKDEGKSALETIIVSDPSDPYYPLAQKIAQSEGFDIGENLEEALQYHPRFIILVASPENLTSERFSSMGRFFKGLEDYPGLGIISGSSLENAEQLWERRGLAQEGINFVGGDVEASQRVFEPAIYNISDGADEKTGLNKGSLIEALEKADYLYWARHSAATNWFWNEGAEDWGEDDELFVREIPALKPAVIYSLTCSSFRPWVEDSMALGFVDRGAAAYLGHLNSPHSNAFLKHGLAVPGLTTWKEFPLGIAAQIQNKVAAKTIFATPQIYMLGDPRIHLSPDRPYRILSDTVSENGKRIIEGEAAVGGVLAIKLDNASEYDFVQVRGITSASKNDLFYNSKLQMMNLGRDKYLLLLQDGGRFEIELSRKAPFGWRLIDPLTDILDFSWVALWLNLEIDNAPFIHKVALVVFFAILLFKVFIKKKSIREYQKIFLAAFALALLRVGYFLLRLDDYTISANFVDATAFHVLLGGVGVFACTAGGLMLLKDTQKVVIKLLGLLFAVFPQLLLTSFYLGFTTLLNVATVVARMTEPWVLNYHIFWLTFSALLIEIIIVLILYQALVSGKRSGS